MTNDTTCTIQGCERNRMTRGWCSTHYSRWRRNGNPLRTLTPARVSGTPDERFWAKVNGSGVCWEWEGSKNARGYGHFSLNNKLVYAHRYAWTTLVGTIPDDLVLDHLCRNTSCVAPDHLEPVSGHVNTMRGEGVASGNSRKTHCIRGHEFTPENIYRRAGGGRRCKRCQQERNSARCRK
jgi:hypothetical protein